MRRAMMDLASVVCMASIMSSCGGGETEQEPTPDASQGGDAARDVGRDAPGGGSPDAGAPDADTDAAPDADMTDAMDAGDTGDIGDAGDEPTRPFLMGFTVWPYDATLPAVMDTYVKIRAEGDMVTHHFLGGIPWDEALAGDTTAQVEDDVCGRLMLTYPADTITRDVDGVCAAPTRADRRPIYLAVDSLSTDRRDLVEYWGASENQPRADFGWGDAAFDDDRTIDAFSSFASAMVTRFRPRWINYGSELTDLMLEEPERFDAFVVFAERVSARLRRDHPGVRLMVSVALKHPDSASVATLTAGVARLRPYFDVIGVSVYPYAFFGHADPGRVANLPVEWLSQIERIAPNTPVALTETGWIAQDLVVAEYDLNIPASEQDQEGFVEALLSESDALDVEFINWFNVVDYDRLWVAIGSPPLAALWRDAGLYDGDVDPRPALDVWRRWLARPVR